MSWRAPLAALVAAVAAGWACNAPPRASMGAQAPAQALIGAGKGTCPTDAGTCVAISSTSELDGACTDDQWVAYLSSPDGSCPAVGDVDGGTWTGGKLFQESGDPAIPHGLQPYCLYEWTPAAPGNPANSKRLASILGDQVSAMDRDCFVAAPSGSSAGVDAGWRTLRDAFHGETGWLSSLPSGDLSPAKIRVAVVDTAPTYYSGGAPGEDRSGHGHAVGWIIREHACPVGGACIGQIADRLAMPHLTIQARDPADGGYFGSQGEVAHAIHGAVHDWMAFKANGGKQPRLVVNASLGWDPHWGGTEPASQLPLPARAVHDAITHAVCQGALVVTAAGNDPGGPGLAAGPMFPGGWEAQPAPTAADCTAFEGAGYSPDGGQFPIFPPPGVAYRPLVYAVSGVRADDSPLLNARPGGRARTAAPGSHALAADGTGSTDVLTGTSAAAAVISATAATVWGYRPGLTAPEVMQIVRASSTRLGAPADFCLGGSPCPLPTADAEVTRANLCQAVVEACKSGGALCPPALPTCTPPSGQLPTLTEAELKTIWASTTTTYDASAESWYALDGLLVACGDSQIWTTSTTYPVAPCPVRQFFGTPIRPWSGPQPSTNACPACPISESGSTSASALTTSGLYRVTLSIDDAFAHASLTNAVLRINGTYDIDLSGVGPLSGGDVAVIDNLDLSPITPIVTAEIQYTMTDGAVTYSTESELLIQ